MLSSLVQPLKKLASLTLLAALMIVSFACLIAGLSPEPSKSPVSEEVTTVSAAVERPEVSDPLTNVLQKTWSNHVEAMGVEAAPMADWLTVCRRLSLALVGTGTSLEEIRSLELLPEADRVTRHRERLLASPQFADYWAERTTRYLVGADEGPFLVFRRRRFRTWLAEQYAANVRYDDLIRQLIVAQGLWTDRPEVNFYTVTYDSGDGKPDPVRMAARTARAFIGIRIDCMECHDDFLGNSSLGDPVWMGGDGEFRGGTQQDFHSLAAFFTAAGANGLQGIQHGDPNYKVQYLDTTDEVEVPPQVPFRRDLFDATDTNKNVRERLADWLVHPENKQTARAAVVRVWTLLFGRSPTEAVDDLPLDREAPPLVAELADAFIANDFDLRQLIRWITDSPAFRVDSRADFELTARHEQALAVFPIVRLRPEQVAGAALQAGRIHTIDRDSSIVTQLTFYGGKNDFLERYGDLGEDEFRDEAITLTQRLTMLNGKMIDKVAEWNPILSTTAHVGMFAPDDTTAIATTFLAVLNRDPTSVELDHFRTRLESKETNRQHAMEDLVWSLFNSSEFAWNH